MFGAVSLTCQKLCSTEFRLQDQALCSGGIAIYRDDMDSHCRVAIFDCLTQKLLLMNSAELWQHNNGFCPKTQEIAACGASLQKSIAEYAFGAGWTVKRDKQYKQYVSQQLVHQSASVVVFEHYQKLALESDVFLCERLNDQCEIYCSKPRRAFLKQLKQNNAQKRSKCKLLDNLFDMCILWVLDLIE